MSAAIVLSRVAGALRGSPPPIRAVVLRRVAAWAASDVARMAAAGRTDAEIADAFAADADRIVAVARSAAAAMAGERPARQRTQ